MEGVELSEETVYLLREILAETVKLNAAIARLEARFPSSFSLFGGRR